MAWWIAGTVCALIGGVVLGASIAWSVQQSRLEAVQDDLEWSFVELADVSDQLIDCQSAVAGAAGALVPAWDLLDGMTDSVVAFFSRWDDRAGDAFLLSSAVFDGHTAVSGALDNATVALLTCDLTEH